MALQPTWFDRRSGWSGRGYLQALSFCKSKGGRVICPYTAICPLGKGREPLGGVKNEQGGSWVPVSSAPNEWVQVGENRTCELYHMIYGANPDWGLTAKGDEEVTRHIMCCLDLSQEKETTNDHKASVQPIDDQSSEIYHRPPTLEEDSKPDGLSSSTEAKGPNTPSSNNDEDESYTFDTSSMSHEEEMQIISYYKSIWFSREQGWDGQSYEDGVKFCLEEAGGRTVCPYQAYCPDGPGTAPLEGLRGEPGEEYWSPMIMDGNDGWEIWVTVGSNKPCLHSVDLDVLPNELEHKTSHIMCCHDPSSEPPEPPKGNSDPNDVNEAFHPGWFSRTNGWKGSTYEEGTNFCTNVGVSYSLCPFEAICPNGKNRPPLGGVRGSSSSTQWVPVQSDNTEEIWVSTGPSNTCVSNLEIIDPVEITSESTWFIICCSLDSGNIDHSGIEQPSREGGAGPQALPSSSGSKGTQNSTPENSAPNSPSGEDSKIPTESSNNFDPISTHSLDSPNWFSRHNQWHGRTYKDAETFCNTNKPNGVICSYDILCPNGAGSMPYAQNSPKMSNEQWVPVLDQQNSWVLVGQDASEDNNRLCQKYEALNGHQALFGLTGDSEAKKLHVLCCSLNPGDSLR